MGRQRSIVAKVRVYELAKEFGVESKAVMAKLESMGEFVRSASSTIEAPVVRKLKEAFSGGAGKPDGAASGGGRGQGGPRPGGDRPARLPDSGSQQGPGGQGGLPAAAPSAPVAPSADQGSRPTPRPVPPRPVPPVPGVGA